uniref:DUF7796 domain-containing protein n=1 Tax=Kalanchoe fedtschenkoi TaxID=63787 RepID=A0A7N0US55_KALFE
MSLHDFLKAFPTRDSCLSWRLLLSTLPPISILLLILLTLFFPASVSFVQFTPFFSSAPKIQPIDTSTYQTTRSQPPPPHWSTPPVNSAERWREEMGRSRIAVCLVGGARRFELTGPSIVDNILAPYPNADLFLHSPLDENSFKFSLLKLASKIVSLRIFDPQHISETPPQVRLLTADGSPNGIQGLLQYFNLVEGCLRLIEDFQSMNNFTYDWIVRTRVDGYWNAPLQPEFFESGKYIVPQGSAYGGLNDRFGVGDLRTSKVALSRLSLVPKLDQAGFRKLNSEGSFKAQLTTHNVSYAEKRLPFCVVSDRRYMYPPLHNGVPVAAMSSPGPLSGVKCRPCQATCRGECVERTVEGMSREWSWTEWRNGTMELCDAHGKWESGWEREFDRVAGPKYAGFRMEVEKMKVKECAEDFEQVKRRLAGKWEAPPAEEICRLGLSSR